MPDKAITVDEILTSAQHYTSAAHAGFVRAQTVALSAQASLCFENGQSSLYFLQSLIALEGLSCPVSLAAECEVAEAMWPATGPIIGVTLSLTPHPTLGTDALRQTLAGVAETLQIDIAGHLCPVRFEGPASPRMHGQICVPAAAKQALEAPAAQVHLVCARPESVRVLVPADIWRAWSL